MIIMIMIMVTPQLGYVFPSPLLPTLFLRAGIYLTAVMTITSISIIMTVIVLNCHYRGPIQREVPPWMKR